MSLVKKEVEPTERRMRSNRRLKRSKLFTIAQFAAQQIERCAVNRHRVENGRFFVDVPFAVCHSY